MPTVDPTRPHRGRRLLRAVSALVLPVTLAAAGLGTGVATTATASPRATVAPSLAPTAGPSDTTSAKEARRVDRVPTPKLSWKSCRDSFRCATVSLPRDYDHRTGAKVKVALLKYPARTTDKVGTLFLNPGGPGGSGLDLAEAAPDFLPDAILDHFDVVGFDPRGVGASSPVRCFSSTKAQRKALEPLYDIAFPDSARTAKAYLKAKRAAAKACSSHGKPLATSVSTAQVARDLDVLRRAVGDSRLTYLGFSYGTYIGQVYANLFPDRVRALALDGVVDPVAWQGSKKTRNDPAWDRMRSAETTSRALSTLLTRCGEAGAARCTFAGDAEPTAGFATLAQRLKAAPLELVDDDGTRFEYGYDDMVSDVLDDLYLTDGAEDVDQLLDALWQLTGPGTPAADLRVARRAVSTAHRELAGPRPGRSTVVAGSYDSSFDSFVAVNCTDSIRLDKASAIPSVAAKADQRVPYFGALWAWNTPACAKDSFKATDEDAYRGSFTRRTAAPLLFVGDTYDPVTSLEAATGAAALAPNAALVSSESWGHTAYGTSACVDDAVDDYLLTGQVPGQAVTHCVGDYQPFAPETAATAAKPPASERLVALGNTR